MTTKAITLLGDAELIAWRYMANPTSDAMEEIHRLIVMASNELRAETNGQHCAALNCNNVVHQDARGRTREYCSTACRQRVYRQRRTARRAESADVLEIVNH